MGLTCDEPVPPEVTNLRQLAISRFAKVPRKPAQHEALIKKLCKGHESKNQMLIEEFLSRVDTAYMKGDKAMLEEAFSRIIKSMHFLGFFDDSQKLQTKDSSGNKLSYIDAFGGVMAAKMTHGETDRDLVVMQHIFTIED